MDVRTVNTGCDSGLMVKEYRPDLIVRDVMLPDINGKEVCQRVRSDKTMDDVRIICISRMVEEDKVGELRAAGADEDFVETGKGESAEAGQLLRDRFGEMEEGTASETIVFSHPTLTVDDPAYQETVQGLLGELMELRRTFTRTVGETNVVSSRRIFIDADLNDYDHGIPRDFSPLLAQRDNAVDVTFASISDAIEPGGVVAPIPAVGSDGIIEAVF